MLDLLQALRKLRIKIDPSGRGDASENDAMREIATKPIRWPLVAFALLSLVVLARVGIIAIAAEAGRSGTLHIDPPALIYVAKDEESFRMLQHLGIHDPVNLEAAERNTHRRILALGDGQRILLLDEFFFDGNRFWPNSEVWPNDKERYLRVLKVKVLDGSAEGEIVFVPAFEAQFMAFL